MTALFFYPGRSNCDPMQYVSQADINAMATLKQRDVHSVIQTMQVAHQRAGERTAYFYMWVRVIIIVIVIIAIWVAAHFHALRILYKSDVEWFETRYTQGPRPKGAHHVSLNCLLISTEYPVFAQTFMSQTCRSLPQTAGIFLLTMIQTFGDEMEGIHYSGSREQLRWDRFRTFISDYAHWNVPDNPWRFLFRNASMFARSVAVQKAQKTTTGVTMLSALFDGGLCAVATQFTKPDTDAPTMCEELLAEQLVYFQSCDVTRLASAVQNGSTVGSFAGALSSTGGSRAALWVARAREWGSIGKAGLSALTTDTEASAFCGPLWWACDLIAIAVTAAIATAVTAAATGAFYAIGSCPYSQYYTMVRSADGSYVKQAWKGDPTTLPKRVRNR